MKIVVIDGQGGKMGKVLVEQIKKSFPQSRLIAVGTNSIATSAMMKAGADAGATGENPVVVNAADADVIVGPIGIIVADALLGEITPAMALAVAKSGAQKILLPINKCGTSVVGVQEQPLSAYVRLAVEQIEGLKQE
jgi:prephenate dehydrogenase